jgi:hypothetical protein
MFDVLIVWLVWILTLPFSVVHSAASAPVRKT